ncbi:MAG: hypothetical protein KatS3mg104_1465 [Phycisphaerae bacterium]|nr:MAG: hypothetical protein KatS3mg104_1465 [Phycisphaerae bacterium]
MRRSVEIGPQIGPYRRIKSGLKPDDLVIFNGLINVRPESPVQPVFDPPPRRALNTACNRSKHSNIIKVPTLNRNINIIGIWVDLVAEF